MVQPCGLAINSVILFLLYSGVFVYTLNKFIYELNRIAYVSQNVSIVGIFFKGVARSLTWMKPLKLFL